MNIIVLCGGYSPERDVSIKSGAMIAAALRERGHKAVLIDAYFGYTGKYDDPAEIFERDYDDSITEISEEVPDLKKLASSRMQKNPYSRIGDNLMEVCSAADIVFLAMHGSDGENGKLQAAFDIAGVKYTGSGYLGSAIAMNKSAAKDMFIRNNIKTPEGKNINVADEDKSAPCFPCVVKPRGAGSSVGTSIAHDEDEYAAALDFAFEYEDDAVVERYIKGREIDVGVIDGVALPPIEICPKSGFFDYKNKYQSGMTDEYCPADLSENVTERLKKAAVDVFKALYLDVYARMDFIVDRNGEIYCLEANTLPGMTPASLMPKEAAAAGIEYGDLCEMIIRKSLEKYEKGSF